MLSRSFPAATSSTLLRSASHLPFLSLILRSVARLLSSRLLNFTFSISFRDLLFSNAASAFHLAPMATRRMDALFPKRKSSAPGAMSAKLLSVLSFKSRDLVYGTYDDISSGSGTLGAAASQPAALVFSGRQDLNEEYDDVEEILRQFDMNMAYGPCLGITRLERYQRSCRLGLNPPMDVKNLLERVGGNRDALWEGCV